MSEAININQRIRVRLTPFGLLTLLKEREYVVGVEQVVASGGVWETHLWELMHVIGPTCTMGSLEQAIVGNRIELVGELLNEAPLPPPPRARED